MRPSRISAQCKIFVSDQLQLEILGARAGSEICLYARRPRQVVECSLESLTAVRLSHLARLPVHQLLRRANLSLADLQEYFAHASASHSLDGYVPRGAGLYRDDTELLIVSGNQACRWDGRHKAPLQSPLYKNHLHELDPGFPLIPHLNDLLREAAALTRPRAQAIWKALVALVNRWRWVQPGAAVLVAGQILATILQSTWRWKGHSYVSAKRNTGKSTFLETLAALLGPMVRLFGGETTEAAIRQCVGLRGHYLLLDEFERNTEREKILRLLRQANHGGTVAKGSPNGQVHTFHVSQLAWLASIDRPGDSAADSSRYLTFELHSVTPAQKAVGLPSPFLLGRLRRDLYRLAFKYFREFWEAAETLSTLPDTGLDGRILDAIAVPCGIWATVKGVPPADLLEEAMKVWKPMLDDQIIEDEYGLVRAIFHVKFKTDVSWERRTNRPEWRTIGDALCRDYSSEDLEAYGVKRAFTKQCRDIAAFSPEAVRRYCLGGTHWAKLNIRDLLLRLPGAMPTRLRMAGMDNARVVAVPMETIFGMAA